MTLVRYVCHSFTSLACAECNNSLPFSGASSIPLSFHPYAVIYVCIYTYFYSIEMLAGRKKERKKERRGGEGTAVNAAC